MANLVLPALAAGRPVRPGRLFCWWWVNLLNCARFVAGDGPANGSQGAAHGHGSFRVRTSLLAQLMAAGADAALASLAMLKTPGAGSAPFIGVESGHQRLRSLLLQLCFGAR